jgi:hypothetical protein
MGADVSTDRIDEYAGLHRQLELGVRLAPTRAGAVSAAKALAAFLDEEPAIPVRLAGLAADPSRVLITVAVTLGHIDDIKVAGTQSRAAVLLIQRIVDELSAFDPAFVTLPEPSSAEARLAAHASAQQGPVTVLAAVRRLASVG